MKPRLFLIWLLIVSSTQYHCTGQNRNHDQKPKRVGGECEEGYCELMYLGMPDNIHSVDTSAGWYEEGRKLVISGTVFNRDGITPAPDVIVYYHHTDNNGYYSPRSDKPENQTRHGHIRGWVKTGKDGKYTLYTIRPAPYPNTDIPAHIHILIKEPDIGNEYWTDDLVFEDDQLLQPYLKKHNPENRCGSGILQVVQKDSLQYAEHHFVLGLNIPDYPVKR